MDLLAAGAAGVFSGFATGLAAAAGAAALAAWLQIVLETLIVPNGPHCLLLCRTIFWKQGVGNAWVWPGYTNGETVGSHTGTDHGASDVIATASTQFQTCAG